MKKLFLGFLLLACQLLPAQGFQIVALNVVPPNPNVNDVITIATHVSAGYMGFKISQSYTVNLNTINLEACYYLSNVPVITQYLDTFVIGQLPIGTYTVNFKAHLSSLTHACNIIGGQDRDSSTVFYVSALSGISEKRQADLLQISPNPVKDLLSLSYPVFLQHSRLKILDVLGQIVYEQRLSGSRQEIEFSGFARGVYFISIQSDSGQKIYRVVKE